MGIVRVSVDLVRKLGLDPTEFGLDRRPHKYRAQRVAVDGITFDSKKEAQRYAALRQHLRAGVIVGPIELQVPYPIYVPIFSRDGEVVGLQTISAWLADFRYRDARGALVIEDAKGFRTRMYRLKKKAVEAQYGIRITEV